MTSPPARAFPEDRLTYMLTEMRGVKVEELGHQDYQSLLRVLGILVGGLSDLAKGPNASGARKILAQAAQRAARDQLPTSATDPEHSTTQP